MNKSKQAMLEAVTDELLAHGEFSSSGNNRPNAKVAAQAVIDIVLAALRASAPQEDGRALEPPVWEDHDMGRAYREELSAPPSVALEAREAGDVHPILKHADELHDLGFNAGWNGAVEECLSAMPSTATNPNESNYQRGRFDSATEYQRAIRALTRPQPGGAVAAKMCSCKASERDGQHMAWCSSISPGGAVAGTERGTP